MPNNGGSEAFFRKAKTDDSATVAKFTYIAAQSNYSSSGFDSIPQRPVLDAH
jgi:hypothetical protein